VAGKAPLPVAIKGVNMTMRTRSRWMVLLLLLAGQAGHAAAQTSPAAASNYAAVTIDGTELRTIHSSIVGQEYLLKVRLPDGYENSEKRYPVLYLLDGDFAFAMATDIVQYLEWGGHVPELIIVSPAYGSKRAPRTGGNNMRNRDLLPFARPSGGDEPGAEKFLRFLGEELIPYVDAHFRTIPADRTLSGYSMGAGFGLYALFSQPGLFPRNVFVDGFASGITPMEAEFAARHTDLPATVYLSSGVPGAELRFTNQLRERQYPGLRIEYAQLAGVTHDAVAAEGLTRGLKYVFSGKSIFEEMLHTLQAADLASAIALYHERKRTTPQEYRWSEGELDELGTALRLMGRMVDALEVYRMNVEIHPDAWSSYNSLANAYLTSGDNARAIANFERALALNPHNEHAAEMLRRLKQN
jgi:tetratricopeptide (TPR) repeat protein